MIRMKSSLSPRVTWSALMTLLCLLGLFLIIYSTVWGAALTDDSFYYISSARNFLAGKGFDLTSHFTPLLPLLLSGIGIFKFDPLNSIRWLNAILFAANIYFIARIIFILTGSRMFSLLGGFFALISSTLIMVHAYAMSEALFITLMLVGLWLYVRGYRQAGWRTPLLVGLAFGLAAVTRYIGIALLLAGGVYWLFEPGEAMRARLRNAAVFSLTGIAPLVLWMIRNEIIFSRPVSRVFAVHPIPPSAWRMMANTVLLWLIPGRFVHGKEIVWLIGICAVIVGLLIYQLLRKRTHLSLKISLKNEQKPVLFLCAAILAYLLILIISRTFFDILIPMDERLLSPVLVLGILLAVWQFACQQSRHKWISTGMLVILALVFSITNLTRSAQMIQSYHELGRGYASSRDHISETYAYLRNRPDTPVYSNAFAAIYFWTGRVTYQIPTTAGINKMKEDMKRTGALLVIFDSIRVELYGTTKDELTQGLVEEIRLSEATIYRSP